MISLMRALLCGLPSASTGEAKRIPPIVDARGLDIAIWI
jgi:hypothetical protein